MWESIWLEEGKWTSLVLLFPNKVFSLQLDCSADTERSQILMALKGSPHIDYWSDTNLLRRSNHHLNNHRGWNPTYMDLIRRQGLRRDLIGSACPPQMAWYLAGGTCTNGSDHIDRRSPWECEITWFVFSLNVGTRMVDNSICDGRWESEPSSRPSQTVGWGWKGRDRAELAVPPWTPSKLIC